MNAPTKPKFPRTLALEVARELVKPLKPVTDRLIVAGSLRRGKPEVGDVEIVLVPRTEMQRVDLLLEAPVSLAEPVFANWLEAGVLTKRPSTTGTTAWGEKNRLALHAATRVPVDFFLATPETWWNVLVCRTGPGALNVEIARRARDRGWKWQPYGRGYENVHTGEVREMSSEREVLEFVGLPDMTPEERQRKFS